MASNGERCMIERLRDPPRLGLKQSDGEEEEGIAKGGVSIFAVRCGVLELAGGVEGGGFSLPGLGGIGGGVKEIVSSAGSSNGGAAGARPELRVDSDHAASVQGFGLYGGVVVVKGMVLLWWNSDGGYGGFVAGGDGGYGGIVVGVGGRCGKGGLGRGGVVAGRNKKRDGSDLLTFNCTIVCHIISGGGWYWRWNVVQGVLERCGGLWDVGWNCGRWGRSNVLVVAGGTVQEQSSLGRKKRAADRMETVPPEEVKGANPFLPPSV